MEEKKRLEWLDRLFNACLVGFACYTLFQTQDNTNRQQKEHRNDVDREMAQNLQILDMERTRDRENAERERVKDLQDSIRNEQIRQLTEQQILALRAQAAALKEGIRNTEISQRPYLGISKMGFNRTDNRYIWLYEVINYGVRPAIVKKVEYYLFDKDFQFHGPCDVVELNNLVVGKEITSRRLKTIINNVPYIYVTREQLLKIPLNYAAFIITYYDPFLKQTVSTVDNPTIIKWSQKTEETLDASMSVSENNLKMLYSYESCTKVEVEKVLQALKMARK